MGNHGAGAGVAMVGEVGDDGEFMMLISCYYSKPRRCGTRLFFLFTKKEK